LIFYGKCKNKIYKHFKNLKQVKVAFWVTSHTTGTVRILQTENRRARVRFNAVI